MYRMWLCSKHTAYNALCLHRLISVLGSGQFGSVDKGVWRSGATVKEVAVKTLTDSANIVKFLQEAAIMAQFRHPNVVTLYGVVSRGKPVCYVYYVLRSKSFHSVKITIAEDDSD